MDENKFKWAEQLKRSIHNLECKLGCVEDDFENEFELPEDLFSEFKAKVIAWLKHEIERLQKEFEEL